MVFGLFLIWCVSAFSLAPSSKIRPNTLPLLADKIHYEPIAQPFVFPNPIEGKSYDKNGPEWLHDTLFISGLLEAWQNRGCQTLSSSLVEVTFSLTDFYKLFFNKFKAHGFDFSNQKEKLAEFLAERINSLQKEDVLSCFIQNDDIEASFSFRNPAFIIEFEDEWPSKSITFCFPSRLHMVGLALWVSDHRFFSRQLVTIFSSKKPSEGLVDLLRQLATCLESVPHLRYEKIYVLLRALSVLRQENDSFLEAFCIEIERLLLPEGIIPYRSHQSSFEREFEFILLQIHLYLREIEEFVSNIDYMNYFSYLKDKIVVEVSSQFSSPSNHLSCVEDDRLGSMVCLGANVLVLKPFYWRDKYGKSTCLDQSSKWLCFLSITLDNIEYEEVSVYQSLSNEFPYEVIYLDFQEDLQFNGQKTTVEKLTLSYKFALSVHAFFKEAPSLMPHVFAPKDAVSVVSCNDVNSALVPAVLEYFRLSDYPDCLQGAHVVMTAQTNQNTLNVYEEDYHLICSVLPQKLYHFGFGCHLDSNRCVWDAINLGLNFSTASKTVSNLYTVNSQNQTPLNSLHSIPNKGDFRSATPFFRRGSQKGLQEYSRYDNLSEIRQSMLFDFQVEECSDDKLRDLIQTSKQCVRAEFFALLIERAHSFRARYYQGINEDLPIVSYSGSFVDEKASLNIFTQENIHALLKRGVNVVISIQDHTGKNSSFYRDYIQLQQQVELNRYLGKLVVLGELKLHSESLLLAATTVHVLDSNWVSEGRDLHVGLNAGIQLFLPYHDPLASPYGVSVNFEDQTGSVLVPYCLSSDAYLGVLNRFFDLTEGQQLSHQVYALRNSRIACKSVVALGHCHFFNELFSRYVKRSSSQLFESPYPVGVPQIEGSYEIIPPVEVGQNNTETSIVRSDQKERKILISSHSEPCFYIRCRVNLMLWSKDAVGVVVRSGGRYFNTYLSDFRQEGDEFILTYGVQLPDSFFQSALTVPQNITIQWASLSNYIGQSQSYIVCNKSHLAGFSFGQRNRSSRSFFLCNSGDEEEHLSWSLPSSEDGLSFVCDRSISMSESFYQSTAIYV